MQERVKILGVCVDKVRLDRLFSKTQTYLNQESSHLIYFVGMKTVFEAESNEEFIEFLEQCDFVITAERTMEEKIYGDKNTSSKERMLLAGRYLERLLVRMNKSKLTLYLLGNDQEQLDQLSKNLVQCYGGIKCYGSCIEEETKEEAVDFIVNDINSAAPDVMFILMNGKQTMEFLKENRARMNVKICLCIGEAEEEVLQEIGIETEIPAWIKRLRLEKLYRYFFDNHNLSHTVLKKMFQKKMKEQEIGKESDNNSKK